MVKQELIQTRATDYFEQAIYGLRQQVWIGFLLFWLIGVTATRWMRYRTGVEATPATIAMMIVIYGVIFASFWLRKSRYAPLTQTAFLVVMHVMVPVGLFFYGSIQGLGDIALYSTMIISLVLGWRWWMYITLGSSMAALIYMYYATIVGLPALPFLEHTALFATIKVLLFCGVIGFTIYYGNRFYRSLLKRHQQFAEEQVRLTEELQASDRELRQVTQALMASRQQIVTAQDEERRRLRHDLTDDLGPKLAGLVLQAGAAQQFLPTNQERADQVLADLETGIEQVLGNVRTFVYALRPPLLDQLGLLGAIRELANQLCSGCDENRRFPTELNQDINAGFHINQPLAVELVLPEQLKLGAATEVACFKIVQSTLEHLAHQDKGRACKITLLDQGEDILLEICGNGIETDGVETDGVETDGVETDGVETDGVETDGVETDGIETDGVETDGIETDGVEGDEYSTASSGIQVLLPTMQEWAEELTGTVHIVTQDSGRSCLKAQLPNTLCISYVIH